MPTTRTPTAMNSAMHEETDTIRAIVCIVLVLHHLVGISPAYGLELPLDHPVSILSHTTEDMRMPVFSFLSGLVFPKVSGHWNETRHSITKKARRLLLPMAMIGTLFWGARHLAGITQPPLPEIYFTAFAHFWFLQASFLIMLTALLLSCLLGGARHKQIAVGLSLLGILWWGAGILPLPATNWFSVSNAVFLLPFFMGGYLLAQSPELRQRLRTRANTRMAGTVLLASGLLIGWQIAVGDLTYSDPSRRIVSLLLGGLGCIGLILVRPRSRQLAQLGTASYAIYLFHVFFTAAVVKIWMTGGNDIPLATIVVLGVLIGTFGPMLLQRLLLRQPLLALLCLGLPLSRTRSQASPRTSERGVRATSGNRIHHRGNPSRPQI